jgi:hypothetical protein
LAGSRHLAPMVQGCRFSAPLDARVHCAVLKVRAAPT